MTIFLNFKYHFLNENKFHNCCKVFNLLALLNCIFVNSESVSFSNWKPKNLYIAFTFWVKILTNQLISALFSLAQNNWNWIIEHKMIAEWTEIADINHIVSTFTILLQPSGSYFYWNKVRLVMYRSSVLGLSQSLLTYELNYTHLSVFVLSRWEKRGREHWKILTLLI